MTEKIVKSTLILFLLLLGFSSQAMSGVSELSIFYRCYAQVTQSFPTAEMQIVKDVKNGKDPVQACLEILDKGRFVSSGSYNGIKINSSFGAADREIARNVVNTFHSLHYSWFETKFYPEIEGSRGRNYANVVDPSTPALYMTKALFDSSYPYSAILKGDTFYMPLRELYENRSPFGKDEGMWPYSGIQGVVDYKNPAEIAEKYDGKRRWMFINEKFPMKGRLEGIGIMVKDRRMKGWHTRIYNNYEVQNVEPFSTGPVNLHLGGGLIGNAAYVLQASKMPPYYPVTAEKLYNGTIRVNRRWGQALYKDIFCRELPVVREKDGVQYVSSTSTVPFRGSSGCVKCHASMDRVAGVVRNTRYENYGSVGLGALSVLKTHPVTKAAAAIFPTADDKDYYLRPPTGTLFFRTHDGKLIDETVSSVEDLGNKMAQKDEMYVCLAKRYYEYFTGISADINDIGDPDHPALTEDQKIVRNIVIDLGLKLKAHQNPRKLVEDILSRPEYRTSDYGVRSPKQ